MAQDTARSDVGEPAIQNADSGRNRSVWLIGAAAVLALLLRLPFVFTGLSTDDLMDLMALSPEATDA